MGPHVLRLRRTGAAPGAELGGLVAAAANDASCAAAEWDAVRLGIGGLAEHTARWLRRYSSP